MANFSGTTYGPYDGRGFRIRLSWAGTQNEAANTSTFTYIRMYLESTNNNFSSWTHTTYMKVNTGGSDVTLASSNKQYSIGKNSSLLIHEVTNRNTTHNADGTKTWNMWCYMDANSDAFYVVNNAYLPSGAPATKYSVSIPTISQTPVYTVNINGSTYNVEEGQTFSFPSAPAAQTGYYFAGWSYNGGFTTSSTFVVYGDVSFSPVYYPYDYTLYFNANGGSVFPSSREVAYNSTYGSLPIPSRSGYSFNGWYTSPSGGSQVYSTTVMGQGATIYAQWTALAPGFVDQSVASTLIINQNINSVANNSVSATNTDSYSILYSGSGANPTGWLSIDNSGNLSGSTSIAGNYTFKIRATSSAAQTQDSNTLSIDVVYPGARTTSLLNNSSISIARRFDGSQWVPLTLMKRWNGSSWVDITNRP